MNVKTKNLIKWMPGILAGCIVGASASLKLCGFKPLVDRFTGLGLGIYVRPFGSMELLFMGLFLHPRTMKTGFHLLTAYFGGAIAIELRYGMTAAPAVILSLVWLAAYLRNPALFRPQAHIQTI